MIGNRKSANITLFNFFTVVTFYYHNVVLYYFSIRWSRYLTPNDVAGVQQSWSRPTGLACSWNSMNCGTATFSSSWSSTHASSLHILGHTQATSQLLSPSISVSSYSGRTRINFGRFSSMCSLHRPCQHEISVSALTRLLGWLMFWYLQRITSFGTHTNRHWCHQLVDSNVAPGLHLRNLLRESQFSLTLPAAIKVCSFVMSDWMRCLTSRQNATIVCAITFLRNSLVPLGAQSNVTVGIVDSDGSLQELYTSAIVPEIFPPTVLSQIATISPASGSFIVTAVGQFSPLRHELRVERSASQSCKWSSSTAMLCRSRPGFFQINMPSVI